MLADLCLFLFSDVAVETPGRMSLPAIGAGRLCRDLMAGASSRGVLFSAKATYFRVPTLRGSVAVFVAFEALIDGGTADGLLNSPGLVLPEEFIGVDNHVGVHGGGKFYHQGCILLALTWLL